MIQCRFAFSDIKVDFFLISIFDLTFSKEFFMFCTVSHRVQSMEYKERNENKKLSPGA